MLALVRGASKWSFAALLVGCFVTLLAVALADGFNQWFFIDFHLHLWGNSLSSAHNLKTLASTRRLPCLHNFCNWPHVSVQRGWPLKCLFSIKSLVHGWVESYLTTIFLEPFRVLINHPKFWIYSTKSKNFGGRGGCIAQWSFLTSRPAGLCLIF